VLRRLLVALAAVLAGNALYFALLEPHLPGLAQHRPFQLDLGLLFDALLCLACYALLARFAGKRSVKR